MKIRIERNIEQNSERNNEREGERKRVFSLLLPVTVFSQCYQSIYSIGSEKYIGFTKMQTTCMLLTLIISFIILIDANFVNGFIYIL